MKTLKKFIACFILSMAAYYYNYLKSVAIARVSLSILTLSITESFCLFWSNNQQQIYSIPAGIPAGCRFSNRLLTAGKESGGLRSVEDK